MSGFTKANPLPQSIDDYGDYDNSKNLERRQGKEDDKLIPVGDADQVDPIGDIFGDILGGVGALLTEGIKIVTDVTDGSKNATEVVGDALKVASAFAKTYGEVAVEGLSKFIEDFGRRLRCN